ncbi:hypothetical protein LRR18_11805 [Mangrovimonas sp. AS39]|uniref:hypothetical protein n=1 Tax=Mangrovimonas futianensis TaxID=2895523 RepID=UPI001E3B885E|nr:hypothetical protein [Mangrovimonas futianensis]MCF1192271.1 hypothetical protein [Mangrovimonas futianensis]MCF1195980.1 hypothetical protein [Mangrovimonas futianensis]MCF1422962.1 hypothetical protein [Mangrovimonas futianensis]
MSTNHFSICLSCINQYTCILTTQKDKVWSCSEYDDNLPNSNEAENVQESDYQLELA